MKTKLSQERGQALILIAVAMVGLIAIISLAVDGSAAFSDRRHAQSAADTAALAGALAKINGNSAWQLAALNRAGDNGYTGDIVNSTVEVYNPPISGIYSNCSDVHFTCTDYIQVIITSNVKMFFAHIIGIDHVQNRVEAVARTISQNNAFNFGGNAIVALSPTGCALQAGGSTAAVINGGIFSNSDDGTCSFKEKSCAAGLDINQSDGTTPGTITMVGGYDPGSCTVDATTAPATKQISFPPPYQEIAEPAACSTAGTKITGNPTTVTLDPGYYATMPPKANMTNITLNPGVYCIGSTMKANSGDIITVAGTFGSSPGIFLYFKPGGYFTFNGSSTVNLWGINASNDSSLAAYMGYLMYLKPDYSLSTPPKCTMNGGSTSAYQGTIYAPYCDLVVNGSSGLVIQSQLIGYTVDLSGASGVTLNYNAGSNATWTIPMQVGLSK
jgi:hypothetical protein